jgi:hypothetical protein
VKTILVAGFCLLATSVHAQTVERGFVQGVGGVTFGVESAGTLGGEVGFNVHPNIQIYGGAGRMLNVMPKSLQRDLDDAADLLTIVTGQVWGFNGKVPATYFGGGAKFIVPTSSAVRPYFTAGAGLAQLKASIKEIDFGEITDDLINEGYIDEDDVKGTNFMFEFGGGIVFPLGGVLQLDTGYRFTKISEANVSRVSLGVGARF